MQDVDAHSWDAGKAALPAWSLPKDALETIALATQWPERVTREWAFEGATGKGVRVCILDSGVDASHPAVGELESAVAISIGEDDEVVATEDTEGDVSGHGTACAGIVRQLAPEASISSVRILGANFTGSGNVLLGGLRYAIDQGFDVINMSLSTTKKPFASILHELADNAYFRRTVLVASAHNMPVESYPWRFSSVISVGSHEEAAMGSVKRVYVALLNEGTKVYRPVDAVWRREGVFEILSQCPEDETWAFSTGDLVRCRKHTFSGGTSGLLAVERVDS